jgi:ribosomal protein S18 acetylase RimI-like enzyme
MLTLSPKRTTTSDFNICPLTFWHIYRSMGALIESMLEHDDTYQEWVGRSGISRVLARVLALPAYYHLTTSGYGAFAGEELAGWLYLRGWRQVMYVDTLAIKPAWRRRGLGKTLLDFAEAQARELHRQWLGLTVTTTNEGAVRLYERQGFRRTHWQVVLCDNGKTASFGESTRAATLRPIFGAAAWQAYHHYSTLDLAAGDGWAAPVVPHLLDLDPHRQWGRDWLVILDGQPVAYLNRHGSPTNPRLYLASSPDWWGHASILQAVGLALNGQASQSKTLTLRLASSSHHEAALLSLTEKGFMTHPATQIKMLKYLGDSTTSSPREERGTS